MSLIYLKNDDNSVSDNTSKDHMKPYRWTNYFTQPIKVAPNSQVAYVSSTFAISDDDYIEGEPFVLLIGTPQLNPSLNIYLKRQLLNGTNAVNEIGHLCNEYSVDGDYNNIWTNSNSFVYGGQLQGREFQTGFNTLLKADKKTDLRVVQRGINDKFMQGFNCVGANGTFTYAGAYNSPAGINTGGVGTGAIQSEYLGQVAFDRTSSSAADGILTGFPSNCKQPRIDNANLARTTTNNFYNTGWASNSNSNNATINQAGVPFNWGANSASVNRYRHFNQNAYSMISTRVGIKKNITMSGVPTDNGGGHQTISANNISSGGYAMITFANTAQAEADTHYDAGYCGAANVGFCGIAQQSFGVHSVDYINKYCAPWDGTGAASRKEFLNNNDLNASPVAGSSDPENALYAKARYIFGVDLVETALGGGNDTLEARVKWLSPTTGSLDQSYYSSPATAGSNTGFTGVLDIARLSKGINTATNPPTLFDAGANYQINTIGATGLAAFLVFRFRWTSPYTMCCEFTLKVNGDPATYNLETDTPYLPATTPNDPTTGWCMLYDLKQDFNTFSAHYIPSFMGDIGMVAYPSVIYRNDVLIKGYFDNRRSSQAEERILANAFGAELNDGMTQQDFFSPSTFGAVSLYKKNSNIGGDVPAFMATCTPEEFAADGTSTKEIKLILNELTAADDANKFSYIGGAPLYTDFAPANLHLGREVGLIVDKGILDVNNDIAGTGTPYVEYGNNGVAVLDAGTQINSCHIQLRNLPIQSQQAVKSTMNKTIYVVNSLNATNSLAAGTHKRYSDRATELLWIDLNNLNAIELNSISVLITNDDNNEQTLLLDETDIVVMIRAKPKSAEGYVPNNIPVLNNY